MAITDSTFSNLTGEVRIREGKMFQQVPNLVVAGEDLADGMFVTLSADNEYMTASQTEPATHLALKSGEPRLTHQEIANLTGIVQLGEPVMATTGGPGTVTIPFASDVSQGDELTVNNDGYAVRRPTGEVAYVIGIANETVTISDGATINWGEAFITLPAQYREGA